MQSEGQQQAGDIGHVVLCSAKDCDYNMNAKCIAEAVHVMLHSDHADCNTYTNNHHQGEMEEVSVEMEEEY